MKSLKISVVLSVLCLLISCQNIRTISTTSSTKNSEYFSEPVSYPIGHECLMPYCTENESIVLIYDDGLELGTDFIIKMEDINDTLKIKHVNIQKGACKLIKDTAIAETIANIELSRFTLLMEELEKYQGDTVLNKSCFDMPIEYIIWGKNKNCMSYEFTSCGDDSTKIGKILKEITDLAGNALYKNGTVYDAWRNSLN